jgi:hypothetical protein
MSGQFSIDIEAYGHYVNISIDIKIQYHIGIIALCEPRPPCGVTAGAICFGKG